MFYKQIKPALLVFATLTVITGVLYPLSITAIGQIVFPHRANGSIITRDAKPVGSSLIGQEFSDPKYFWGRLSATAPYPYNGASSSGSNLGPNNPNLTAAVEARLKALREAKPGNTAKIPVDLVTSSTSGLDPHISFTAAEYQAGRVAKARGLDETTVRALVAKQSEGRWLGIFGEPVVSVLELNLSLDGQR